MDSSLNADALLDDLIVRRGRLAIWMMGLLAIIIGFATVARPLVSDLSPVFTVLGVVNTVLMAGLWFLFQRGLWYRQAPALLLVLSHFLLLPLLLVSGGPNSQFASLIPILPVVGVLLGGQRQALVILVFWLTVLPVMYYLIGSIPDITDEGLDPGKTAARAFWLGLSSVSTFVFAGQFEKRTRLLEVELKRLAEHDALTGIGNRRLLEHRLNRELSRARRHNRWLTLMLIDVDHFKQFNDSRGHSEGDNALRQVAQVLVSQTRKGQDTVARFGGEEFIVVLGETSPTQAQLASEKIRAAIEALQLPYSLQDSDSDNHYLTATVGMVSAKGDNVASADQLLGLADAALYEGKLNGRNQVVAEVVGQV